MFVVAVTRWGPELDAHLPALAERLGLFAYDLRMRLAGPLPVIVGRFEQREVAVELMGMLRGWGHGAVGCDLATVPAADGLFQVRSFEFVDGRLLLQSDGAVQRTLTPADVHTLIHALILTDTAQTETRSKSEFSAARAVISGGLVTTRKTSSTSRLTESEAEERLYLFPPSLTEPALFCQHRLRYAGLGEQIGHSSLESFAALRQRLRAFAPAADYDDQLFRTRRKTSFESASSDRRGKANVSSVSHSNVSSVDLAVRLILLARLHGQG